VNWLLMNIIPAVAIWGAMSGIPLWMVLRRPDRVSTEPKPASARPQVYPADMPLAAEQALVRAHREHARAERLGSIGRSRVPPRVPAAASR
jgi:hypothetical protein